MRLLASIWYELDEKYVFTPDGTLTDLPFGETWFPWYVAPSTNGNNG